jgi:hypothetical protein
MICSLCKSEINTTKTGEPYLEFKDNEICSTCYLDLIWPIYKMAGYGDGGLVHIAFKWAMSSSYNKKRRRSLSVNKNLLDELFHKYKFSCVYCGIKENLTIDHKKPVALGGTDEFSNLQILCKSCNSKKGKKNA